MSSDSLSGCVMLSWGHNVDSMCLVRECRDLEECFGTNFNMDILRMNACSAKDEEENPCLRQVQTCGAGCKEAPLIVEVAGSVGWASLWDAALDHGWKTVRGVQMINRAMSHHCHGSQPAIFAMQHHYSMLLCWNTSGCSLEAAGSEW